MRLLNHALVADGLPGGGDPTSRLNLLDGFGDEAAALGAALDLAVTALGADTAALFCNGRLVAASGPGLIDGRRRPGAADASPTVATPPGSVAAPRRRERHLAVPVGTAGVVSLAVVRRGERFSPEHARLLTTIARALAPVEPLVRVLDRESLLQVASDHRRLENVDLARRLERRHSLLQQLLRMQRLISGSAPLQTILDEIVAAAIELIGDEAGNIRLQDPADPQRLILAGRVSGPSAGIARVESIRVGEGATGRAFSEERLVVVEDYAHTDAGTIPAYTATNVTACMAAPVRQSGRVIGSMVVATGRRGRTYSVEEREMLLAFAEHASLALTDAQRLSAVEHLAYFDSLTGLPNRARFMERLRDAQSRVRDGSSTSVAVLFIDLDNFKIVNDSLGHAAGDHLLDVIGRRLSGSIRTDDVAARLGGDEFAVMLENPGEAGDVAMVAERLLAILNAPVRIAGHVIPVTASMGTALSHGAHDAAELLRNADLAMYRAKAQGRHGCAVYDASMHSEAMARLSLEEELRTAVVDGQFEVHYQPIVALGTEAICEVEALVRWRHPTRGLLAPAHFIPLAEETGIIVPLGEWVLREAIGAVTSWRSLPGFGSLRLAVNISARQIEHAGLVDRVASALALHDLDARALTLEITESVILEDSPAVHERLQAFRSLGVRLALDDFGTGHSSLARLRRLPVDVLKIDRSFVSDLGNGADSAAMIAAIVGFAGALRLEVVAEGVEDDAQAAALWQLGCRLGQGYLFARPMPAAAIRDLLTQPRWPRATSGEPVRRRPGTQVPASPILR